MWADWLPWALGSVALIIGYAWGRREGKNQGFLEGIRFAPLQLREHGMLKGFCPLCGAGPSIDSQNQQCYDMAIVEGGSKGELGRTDPGSAETAEGGQLVLGLD